MKELADQRKRFGCCRLHLILKREELVVNEKRTERIYREEKLIIRARRTKETRCTDAGSTSKGRASQPAKGDELPAGCAA